MQLVRESATFFLFRRDQLIGESRALGLSHLRFREQPRVLVLACSEIREHGRAHDVVAVERAGPCQSHRPDLLLARLDRDHDRVLRGRLSWTLPRLKQSRARFEQPLGLSARFTEHIRRAGDRGHRLDERLQEARFARQLELGRLVAASFGDDQERSEGDGTGNGEREPHGDDRRRVDHESDHRDHGRGAERGREQPRSSR